MKPVPQAQQAERGLLGLFIAVLIWAPLPLASNRAWAIGWLALALSALLAGFALLQAWHPSAPRDAADGLSRGRWPLILLVAFLGFVVAQLWRPEGTADPQATRLYALRCVVYVTAFALVLMLVRTDPRRMALFYGLLAAGVLQAFLAIGLLAAGADYVMVDITMPHIGRALGTFANADHLAHFMALTLSAGVGIMLSGMGSAQREPRPNWEQRLAAALEFMLSTKMLVRLLLVVLVIALVLSRSRMGNASFFLSLFLLGCWVMVSSAKLRKPAAILVVSLLIVDLVVIGQWVGLEKVVKRMQGTDLTKVEAVQVMGDEKATLRARAEASEQYHREESFQERMRAPADGFRLAMARPWLGWGGGSFYTVFPQFKRAELAVNFWDHAHNDYVEIAADTGGVGLALLGAVVLLTMVRVAFLMRDDQPAHRRGLAVGIAMAMLCGLLHAIVDFNLQIPANALTTTVLLAAAWSMPLAPGRRVTREAAKTFEG